MHEVDGSIEGVDDPVPTIVGGSSSFLSEDAIVWLLGRDHVDDRCLGRLVHGSHRIELAFVLCLVCGAEVFAHDCGTSMCGFERHGEIVHACDGIHKMTV